MIRLIKLSVASLLLIFLSACEGETIYTKTIVNNSSETLTVNAYSVSWGIDSIEVDVTDNKTLVLDVLDNNNWIRESSGGRKSSVNCILEITDEDLQ